MKIAVLAASGKQGTLLVKEAKNRDLDVVAFVRDENKKVNGVTNIVKDIFDLTYDDVKDFDVIIDAFGAWTAETVEQHQTSMKLLINILRGKPNRLLVVGGVGSLYVDSEHTLKVMDTPDFPEDWKPLATNMGAAFENLKNYDDVNWTYLSPSANFDAEGKRMGGYNEGRDELLVNANGESYISYEDYAIAMIDEAVNAKHVKERFTVVSK